MSEAEQCVDIHPTAFVSKEAKLGVGVKVGPYCIVGDDVELGDQVELISHVVVEGRTWLGRETKVYPFTSVGHVPQDLKYKGEPSELKIGERCTIRENCTLNPGTRVGGMLTQVGDDCLLMASTHVAHDCRLGNHVIMANFSGLAGHVEVADRVIFGAGCFVHQHVRIGPYAFLGAQTMLDTDLIPFGMAIGNRAVLSGLNVVGLKRNGFTRPQIQEIRSAYRQLFSDSGTLTQRVEDSASAFVDQPLAQQVLQFVESASERGVCVPRKGKSNG